MRFNWDNSEHIIGHWPDSAAGEFVIRCLGFSSKLTFPSTNPRVLRTYKEKINDLESISPTIDTYWHNFFPTSNSWLKIDYFESQHDNEIVFYELLWNNAQHASKLYFDSFWSDTACEASRDLGIIIKTHKRSEVIGLKHHIPQAKVFTLTNVDQWVNIRYQPARLKKRDDQELPFPHYKFDIDRLLLGSKQSFLSHVRESYHYFNLGDFQKVSDYLLWWRDRYLRWNVDLKMKKFISVRTS